MNPDTNKQGTEISNTSTKHIPSLPFFLPFSRNHHLSKIQANFSS